MADAHLGLKATTCTVSGSAGLNSRLCQIAASRAEAGCVAYAYAEDVIEPGLLRVNEAWTDRAALDAHFETPHMKQWQRERAAQS